MKDAGQTEADLASQDDDDDLDWFEEQEARDDDDYARLRGSE